MDIGIGHIMATAISLLSILAPIYPFQKNAQRRPVGGLRRLDLSPRPAAAPPAGSAAPSPPNRRAPRGAAGTRGTLATGAFRLGFVLKNVRRLGVFPPHPHAAYFLLRVARATTLGASEAGLREGKEGDKLKLSK